MRFVAALIAALALAAPASASSKSSAASHHAQRFLNVLILRQGIRGTPLQGHAFQIEAAAHETGVNPFFMVGASGTESSVFRYACRNAPLNGWGLSSCGSGWYVPNFHSVKEAFLFYGRFILRQWPHAQTPYDLAGYCACGSSYWGSKTTAWIHQLFSDVQTGIRYVVPHPRKVQVARGSSEFYGGVSASTRARMIALIHRYFDRTGYGDTMVRCAIRESGLNPRAYNDDWAPRQSVAGLLQIAWPLWAHPGESWPHFYQRMKDPRANLQLGVQILRRQGIGAWGYHCP